MESTFTRIRRHAVVSLAMVAGTFGVMARDIPAPWLHLSFDREFQIEGSGIKTLKSFPDSPYPGVAKTPAGAFVEGVSGKAFIPGADLVIQGDAVFPAPEGTVSLWIKPVKYVEDWLGGPALSSGRIGPFLTTFMGGEDKVAARCNLQVRWSRHDCCSGLHWVENWPGQVQEFRATGPNAPFTIWQEDKWRMLTVVWFKGERRIYFNGFRLQHGLEVERNPIKPGRSLGVPAGSKAVDELMVWDRPLSDAQVAALFYAQMPQSGLKGAIQSVPRLSLVPEIGKTTGEDAWKNATSSTVWADSFSGMAAAAKDILELGHRDGFLYLRYREPMPENYVEVKTVLGGKMLTRNIVARDDKVWEDDCVELRLTADGGKTNYVLGISASGAVYDARNGNPEFNIVTENWIVHQDAGEKFWTVEMKLNLAALSGQAAPEEWGFNVIRTVRQQGFARRQWSHEAGNEHGYARLVLAEKSTMPVTAEMAWSETTGTLSVAVNGKTETPIAVSYSAIPLGLIELFPEEEEVRSADGRKANLFSMIRSTGRDKIAPPVQSEQRLSRGEIDWQGKLDFVGEEAALATLSVMDDAGKTLSRRAFLIAGSRLVSTRLFNLPSRKELVAQIMLSSVTLAGKDVQADISLIKKGETMPALKTTIAGFSGMMEEKTMDVSGIAVGDYTFDVAVTQGGKLLGKESHKWFKSGAPEWLGNEIGIITTVPAPWIPVTKNGDSIAVWGREHSFTGSLLPAAMRVLNEEILAGPMRLLITTAAGTLDTAVTETPVMKADAAGVRATIAGQAMGLDLKVEMTGVMEFDGFTDLKFTLSPLEGKGPVTVKSIVFEVPFKKHYAELYDDSSYSMFSTKSGAIPAEGMAVANTNTVRVGDTRRGVQFYPLFGAIGKRTTAQPLTLTPAANAMRMRYVVSEGVTLDQPISTSLGLIGTPTKPYDAKRIRMTGHAGPAVPADLKAQGYSSGIYWSAGWSNFNGKRTGMEDGYYNFTPEWCAGLAKSRKAGWNTEGKYAQLYIVPGRITAQTPEYALFWKEWSGQYYEGLEEYVCDLNRYRGAEVRPEGRWTQVDYTRRSYQDFYFYSLDKVLSAFATEGVRVGIYVDCAFHQGDPAPYRQWMQRLYQVTRKHSPDGLIAIHMSGDRRMAVWSMADVLVEGEQYSANWSAYIANKPELTLNDCHPTILPLDRIRATYTGGMWGPQQVFLSQLWTDKRQQEDVNRKEKGDPGPSYYRRMRYSTGLMLAHDAQFWGEFYACGVKDEPWVKRARWGYDDTVQFIPYWDNRGMLEVEGPERDTAVVSAWLKPDGKLMALVLNTANNAATVRLKVNAAKFPVKLQPFTKTVDISSPVPALEPELAESATFAWREGVVAVAMRPRDFRLLTFE